MSNDVNFGRIGFALLAVVAFLPPVACAKDFVSKVWVTVILKVWG